MEPDLFDITANYHCGNPMSVEANKNAHKGKFSAKSRILEAFKSYTYRTGMTCEELEDSTHLSHQSCSARISELKREGMIRKIGTRKTTSGSPAAVYQAI